MELRLFSVNVGLPRVIAVKDGAEIWSGIAKAPIGHPSIRVRATHLDGDGQADLSVHGGEDKAVYCYPADHWPWWEREQRLACRPATFGENLTVAGADETNVFIGDRFRWGEAVLEVTQPRAPCFKFAIHAQRPDAPAVMTASGRTGWYFRVLREGVGQGPLERVHSGTGPCVRDAFFAVLDPEAPRALREAVHAAPALAASWRKAVGKRLQG